MKTLTRWNTRPSGGRITIHARDAHDRPITVTKIATIQSRVMERRGWFLTHTELVVIATHEDGTQFRLA